MPQTTQANIQAKFAARAFQLGLKRTKGWENLPYRLAAV